MQIRTNDFQLRCGICLLSLAGAVAASETERGQGLASDLAGANLYRAMSQVTKLTASDAQVKDQFGYALSISGNHVLVGAYRDDNPDVDTGSAYVFSQNHNGLNAWGEVAKLSASDSAQSDFFGWSVSISGDYAVVGSPDDDDLGSSSGSAYVFARHQGGPNQWGEVTKLIASDGAMADEFGIAVSISGDNIVVGAYLDDDNGSGSGSAYVFARDEGGPDLWGEAAKLTASDGGGFDQFGESVAISGDHIVVGAQMDNNPGTNNGSAYVFSRNEGGLNNWGEIAKLAASDSAAGDQFGFAVSISGDHIVIGAQYDDDRGTNSGSAYVYSRNQGGQNNWGEVAKLTASDGQALDEFGQSVSISSEQVVVGAFRNDGGGLQAGSAYLFERREGGVNAWGEVMRLDAEDVAAADNFGRDVAISGGRVLIGSPDDDDQAQADSGSAYLFAEDDLIFVDDNE